MVQTELFSVFWLCLGSGKFRSLGSLGLLGKGVKDSALAHLLVAHENRSLQTTRGSHGSKAAVCWQVVMTQQMSPLFPKKTNKTRQVQTFTY